MSSAAATRRRLGLRTWDQVLTEVDRLHQGGCRLTGNWGLGQICVHLALALEGTFQGGVESSLSWWRRLVVGPIMARFLLASGAFPAGVKSPAEVLPGEVADQDQAVQRLRRAVAGFQAHRGPWPSHPLLGRLSGRQWERFHLLHASHHLAFLEPQTGSMTSAGTNSPGTHSPGM